MPNEALQYARAHRAQHLDELKQLLSIPSVSAQPEHKPDIQRAAHWLADHFQALGLTQVAVHPTAGHPIVLAEWRRAGGEYPTVLIYGHYDVQPVDPLSLWRSDPFQPEVRGDNLYGRGASDDKGQLFAHVKAVEAFLKTAGDLPVNLKFFIEGEEEIGGPNLDAFIETHTAELSADAALISDSHMLRPDLPTIAYGLRGLAYIQVEVTGPSTDLHSGAYGGAIYNPIQALCEMLASLKDRDGHITLPGFYDKVRPLTQEEREVLAEAPFNEAQFKQEAGVEQTWGETGYAVLEQISARPTLEINGIWGGYQGEGSKTVLPARACAKLSCRLVADQDYHEISDLLRGRLERIAPPQVRVTTKFLNGGHGLLIDRNAPALKAAAAALEKAFGARPVFIREGGSIPVVATLKQLLNIDTVLMGLGLTDDNLHAPNEKFYLPNFYRGIEASIHFMSLFRRRS
ncbi:MAG TPA: dipeptidase [Anaerolineae bacterium]|nr:dipeptidase [Anaerolineae bacterium]